MQQVSILLFFLLLLLSFSALSWEESPPEETGGTGSAEDVRAENDIKVASLLDDDDTKDLHDDSTLLRNLASLGDNSLLLFSALRIWVGGAVQYDYYDMDGLFRNESSGDNTTGSDFRRLEGIFRAQLYDWGELKVQYDFDGRDFRDVYLRWVSDRPNTPITVTIGNQQEPMGLDTLTGNKFEMAQERSAATSAFAPGRSTGIRLHRAFHLEPERRKFDIYAEDAAFVTTSVGIFTSDIDNSHDTDWAITGRVAGGGREKNGAGVHLGFSGSYREGNYNRISLRPGVREADRVTLARPDADTQAIGGFEAAYNKGRFHVQGEAYYSRYDGQIDGYGAGGYLQGGWFLTEDGREYNASWGILAPHRPNGEYSVELFTRIGLVRGDDDKSGWNRYQATTVGANVYYRKLRGSVNVVFSESREPIGGQDDGLAVVARVQYLF